MPNEIPKIHYEKNNQIEKKPRNEMKKTYIFQLHDYLTYIIPAHADPSWLQGVLYRI